MVSPRTLLVLAATLALAAAANSHVPNRWVLQKPTTTTTEPPTTMPPPPPENPPSVHDIKDKITQLLSLIIPKVQSFITVLLQNMGRAVSGAVTTTFKTGFKPLTPMFTISDSKGSYAPVYTFTDLEPQNLEYIKEEEALRTPEPAEEDVQATERKLS